MHHACRRGQSASKVGRRRCGQLQACRPPSAPAARTTIICPGASGNALGQARSMLPDLIMQTFQVSVTGTEVSQGCSEQWRACRPPSVSAACICSRPGAVGQCSRAGSLGRAGRSAASWPDHAGLDGMQHAGCTNPAHLLAAGKSQTWWAAAGMQLCCSMDALTDGRLLSQ